MTRIRKPVLALLLLALSWTLAPAALAKPAPTQEASPPPTTALSYTTTLKDLSSGKVVSLAIDPRTYQALVHLRHDQTVYQVSLPTGNSAERLFTMAQAQRVPVNGVSLPVVPSHTTATVTTISKTVTSWTDRLFAIIPSLIFLVLIAALILLMFNPFGREKIKAAKTGKVYFSDIGGIGEAVEELSELKEFLAHPQRFAEVGARVPKGVLMYGPPGTGKTLMAKAVANEAGVPFFSASGSDFVQMFVGLGALRVRRMFKKARKRAPSIIFIDEIDTLGATRSAGGDGGAREDNRTLNALLKEMDGFDSAKQPVIVVGATNRLDHLDPALIRPGRFDRHIAVDPPDLEGRLEILKLHARKKKLAPSADLYSIARQTTKMAGADLENILNEAAILAARAGRGLIDQEDLDDALIRVIAGARKKNRAFDEEERGLVAYHEAGHAIVGHRLRRNGWIQRISIIPRGGSGGQTFFGSKDRWFPSREELLDELCTLLAGRAAEEAKFGHITTGAGSDLQRAGQLVTSMLLSYGMGETLGLYVPDLRQFGNQVLDERVEAEAKQILQEQYERAKEILVKDEYFALIAEALLSLETIEREEFLAMIGEIDPETLFEEPEQVDKRQREQSRARRPLVPVLSPLAVRADGSLDLTSATPPVSLGPDTGPPEDAEREG